MKERKIEKKRICLFKDAQEHSIIVNCHRIIVLMVNQTQFSVDLQINTEFHVRCDDMFDICHA